MLFSDGNMETGAKNCGIAGNSTRCMIALCLLLALNAPADFIVDLGSASDFLFLDIGIDPSVKSLIEKGMFTGDIGWSGGTGTKIKLRDSTLDGDIYRAAGSSLDSKRSSILLGADYSDTDMSNFIADVDAAVARFGALTQDIDLGSIDQSVGLTIDRTDEYTVVDMSVFKMSSGTLTLNGEADDIFYIRVSDIFELSNVDVVVNGTDSSRVFFIYDGIRNLTYNQGDMLGNIIAPNAAVLLSKTDGFSGSVISGNGFSVTGASKNTAFHHIEAVPETTVLGLVALVGGGALFIHRIFRCRNISSSS